MGREAHGKLRGCVLRGSRSRGPVGILIHNLVSGGTRAVRREELLNTAGQPPATRIHVRSRARDICRGERLALDGRGARRRGSLQGERRHHALRIETLSLEFNVDSLGIGQRALINHDRPGCARLASSHGAHLRLVERHLLPPGINRENSAGIFNRKRVVRRDGTLGRARPHGILGQCHLGPGHAAPDIFRLWGDGLRRPREDGVLERTADVQKAPHSAGQGTRGRLHPERFTEGVRIDP